MKALTPNLQATRELPQIIHTTLQATTSHLILPPLDQRGRWSPEPQEELLRVVCGVSQVPFYTLGEESERMAQGCCGRIHVITSQISLAAWQQNIWSSKKYRRLTDGAFSPLAHKWHLS